MHRGPHSFARAAIGAGMLLVIAQCGGTSNRSASETSQPPATTTETTNVETTAPTRTTVVAPAAANTATVAPEPTTTTPPAPVIDPKCPTTPHGAVIDRDRQRAWLCDNGVALPEFVITSARDLPDPALYHVYDKSMNTSSRFGGHYSTMTHFVAFARGERTGARIAFHTVPVLRNGEFVQPLDSVGTEERFGDSSGCVRVLPEAGPVIWDWLQKGDGVLVLT